MDVATIKAYPVNNNNQITSATPTTIACTAD